MTLGQTTGLRLPEGLPGVATPTGAFIPGCRRRARRRCRRHAMGVVGGGLGTGHLTEVVSPTEAEPLAEVVGEVKVAHLVELAHRTAIEVAEAPRGADQEEARVAPEVQQHPTTPFWPSCVRGEKFSASKQITCANAETVIARRASRSTRTFPR